MLSYRGAASSTARSGSTGTAILFGFALILICLLLGYVVGAGSGAGTVVVEASLVAVAAVLALVIPFEWLIVFALAAIVASDTHFGALHSPHSSYYYLRFLPLGMAAARALLMLTRKVETRFIPSRYLSPFWVLFAFLLVSSVRDHDAKLAFLRTASLGLVLLAFGLGIPAYMSRTRRPERLLHFVGGLGIVCVLAGLLSIPFTTSSIEPGGTQERVRGIFANPNTLGQLAMISFFLLFAWRLGSRHRRGLEVLMALSVVTVIFAGSRASAIGLAVGFLLLIYLRLLDVRWVFTAGLVVFTVVLLNSSLTGGLLRGTSDYRPQLWHRAIRLGMHAPWFGVGMGAVDRVFNKDRPYLESIGVFSSGSHNEYLRLFVAIGVVGACLAVLCILRLWVPAIRTVRADRSQMLIGVLAAAVIGTMANAVFEDGLFAFGDSAAILFWFIFFMLAFSLNQIRYVRDEADRALLQDS